MGLIFGPRGWTSWCQNTPCGCGTNHYVTVEVRHIQVLMRKWPGARVCRTFLECITEPFELLQEVHMAIEAMFKCERCRFWFRRTYEIINGNLDNGEMGKIREWGSYTSDGVSCVIDTIIGPFRYNVLEKVFEEMWDGRRYHFQQNNCHDWSKDFLCRLRRHYY